MAPRRKLPTNQVPASLPPIASAANSREASKQGTPTSSRGLGFDAPQVTKQSKKGYAMDFSAPKSTPPVEIESSPPSPDAKKVQDLSFEIELDSPKTKAKKDTWKKSFFAKKEKQRVQTPSPEPSPDPSDDYQSDFEQEDIASPDTSPQRDPTSPLISDRFGEPPAAGKQLKNSSFDANLGMVEVVMVDPKTKKLKKKAAPKIRLCGMYAKKPKVQQWSLEDKDVPPPRDEPVPKKFPKRSPPRNSYSPRREASPRREPSPRFGESPRQNHKDLAHIDPADLHPDDVGGYHGLSPDGKSKEICFSRDCASV